jgi:hypothetical protein
MVNALTDAQRSRRRRRFKVGRVLVLINPHTDARRRWRRRRRRFNVGQVLDLNHPFIHTREEGG